MPATPAHLVWKERILLAIGAAFFVAVALRFGPMAISYALIPPERGYFRYYQSSDFEHREIYWNYWEGKGTTIAASDIRQGYFHETWELVPDHGHRHFAYDARNEFAGMLTFTRTEMVFQGTDGKQQHYPRELDLRVIWADRKIGPDAPRVRLLAASREEHHRLIAARMQARGLAVSPDQIAQRRPPVLNPAMAAPGPAQPVPLLAITEYGYHNDTGTVFAVYADGTVICGSLSPDAAAPYHQLKIPNAVQFVRDLLGTDYGRQPAKITLSDATDQPATTIWTPEKTLSIYGNWREPDSARWEDPKEWTEADKQFNEDMKRRWDSALAGIGPGLRKSDELRARQDSAWLPKQIEVEFSEYENAADKPIEWPAEWPGLYAETSVKREAYRYSVYVPSADFAKLNAFLANRGNRSAVMIDLNQMVPSVRFPFPAERAWLEQLPPW